jgi:hypothetical protein
LSIRASSSSESLSGISTLLPLRSSLFSIYITSGFLRALFLLSIVPAGFIPENQKNRISPVLLFLSIPPFGPPL